MTEAIRNKHAPEAGVYASLLLARAWRQVTSIWARQENEYRESRQCFIQLRRGFFLLLCVGAVGIVRVFMPDWSAAHFFGNLDAHSWTPKSTCRRNDGWRGDLVSRAKKQAHAKFLAKVDDARARSLGVEYLPIPTPDMVSRRGPASHDDDGMRVVVSKATNSTGMSSGRPALSHTA